MPRRKVSAENPKAEATEDAAEEVEATGAAEGAAETSGVVTVEAVEESKGASVKAVGATDAERAAEAAEYCWRSFC